MSLKQIFKHTLLAGAVLLSTGLFAQQFSSGLTGGFAATQVHGDGITGFNKLGLMAGFFTKLEVNNQLAFRAELNYIGKGSRNPANTDTGVFEKRGYTFHYAELPVLAEYHLERFYVQLGLYGGFLLWGKEMFAGEHFDVINPELRPFDLGAVAGLGFDLTDRMSVFARYTNSVVPIRKAEDAANVTRFWDAGFMNITVNFGVAFAFE